jgi:hypothetical protein
VAESGGGGGSEVVQLLEGAAVRLGRALGKDAAQAAGKLYQDVKVGVGKVVQGVEEADAKVAGEFSALQKEIESGQVPHKVYISNNNNYPERDFKRKLAALRRTTEEGPITAVKPKRDPKVTKAYREAVKARVVSRYGEGTPQTQAILKKIEGMDADHLKELQWGGVDGPSNLKLTDGGMNRSFGPQVYHQTKNLPPGTQIQIIEGPKP